MADGSRGRWPSRRFRWVSTVAIAGAAIAIAAVFITAPDAAPSGARVVVVEMQASAGRVAQLFWAEDLAFTSTHVSDALLAAGSSLQRLRFPIPASGVRWLRLDPTDTAGEVFIQRVQILDAGGAAAAIPVQRFRPGNQIARMVPEDGGLRVTTAAGASDPSLLLPMGCLEPRSIRSMTSTIGSGWLALLSAAVLALLGAALWTVGRSIAASSGETGRGRFIGPAWWVGALVLVVFAGKLLLIRAVPVLTPFWDQWDGEAAVLFVPYGECSLTWRDMLGFHNEHRVFFTRLLALDLLALNGQWDPRLEQVVNAAIHTLTAALAVIMLWLAAGRRRLDLAVVLAALVFALPFSWENSLFGFQSAFYFLLLFSLLAIWLTTTEPTGSVPWVVGWACAACALFTAASGLLAAVVIGAIWALRAADDRAKLGEAAANVAVALAIFGAGYAVSSPPLAHHEVYKVKSAGEFAIALGRSLAWPWIGRPLFALIAWLPLAAVLVWSAWRRFQTTTLERFTIGIGLWVALHATALAYGRGAGGAMPAGRYMDFLSLGFLANAIGLATLLDRLPSRPLARRAGAVLFGLWLVAGLTGLDGLVRQSLIDVLARRPFHQAHTDNVRRLLLNGDSAAFAAKAPLYELPYPDPQRVLNLLQDPYVRRILPAAVRPPVDLRPSTRAADVFAADGVFGALPRDPLRPSWGSFSRAGNAALGRFESDPIEPCTRPGLLQFDVAGHLGFDDHNLAVRDLRTGREKAVVRWGPVRDGWSAATVACPDGAFTVVAVDNSKWSWFAFRAPVEIGRASVAAERLINGGWPLLLTGLILMALAARWT